MFVVCLIKLLYKFKSSAHGYFCWSILNKQLQWFDKGFFLLLFVCITTQSDHQKEISIPCILCVGQHYRTVQHWYSSISQSLQNNPCEGILSEISILNPKRIKTFVQAFKFSTGHTAFVN